jgi:signal transduction histidine kinase
MHYSLDKAGVWGDCVRQRQPVIHNDYAALPHRKGLPPGHAEVRRELVVPTMRDGRIVSILGVGNKPTDYDEQDIELVDYVADVIWNIIERKRAEEQLQAYQRQLEAQNLELDAFGHTVAHDLKNPVAIIISFAEAWLSDHETMSTSDMVGMLNYIHRAGQRLDRIIEALMLLSGIRKQKIVPEPLDMGDIVQEAITRLQKLIQEQQAQITLIDQAAWPVVLGYAPWVEEVWANYISNAIKYGGQPPHIEIGVDHPENQSTDQPAPVRFWVRDNGSGLAPEEQAQLFTPFTRLGQVQVQGHGLGLSIVQRIIEKLGGQVGVESTGTPAQGSTFYFTLPQAPAVDQPPHTILSS